MHLFYDETGTENDQTIIFLHAEGLSGWMWDQQREYFKDYHCIIPDLPEHGRNNGVKPFTIQGAAEMVMDIIREQADGRANLVGISLGAQIIVQILSKAPKIVDHALISGTYVRSISNNEPISKLLNQIINVYGPVKNTDFFIKAYMRMYNMPKTYFEKFKESTHQIDDHSIERILKQNIYFKLPKSIGEADAKLLVMAGEKDYDIIKESSRNIVNKCPNARGALALKTGHLWNLESSNNFNTILMSWFNNDPIPETMISEL